MRPMIVGCCWLALHVGEMSFLTKNHIFYSEDIIRIHELKSHVYVPYVTCWTPYKTGNTKMWNEYASDNGVCIVSTVRQIFMLSRINGARI